MLVLQRIVNPTQEERTMPARLSLFSHFSPPYREFVPLQDPDRWFRDNPLPRGSALLWNLGRGYREEAVEVAEERPGGMALVAILPRSHAFDGELDVFELLERCRPHTVLPHHPSPDPEEMSGLLARPPDHLPSELIDYLLWRGLDIDQETRHLLRRTVELSAELRTITALSRGLYLSRRAFGRRMKRKGLPVPSHWLQFCRVLRAALRLQSSSDNLFQVAYSLGYPDGFTLSNQMHRLTGLRPSDVRACFGWEWIAECWLQRERRLGRLSRPLRSSDPKVRSETAGSAAAAGPA